MAKSKKKLIEIKGTKLEKICLLLQVIILVIIIASAIYANVNNIENEFVEQIPAYGSSLVIILIFVPYFFSNKSNK